MNCKKKSYFFRVIVLSVYVIPLCQITSSLPTSLTPTTPSGVVSNVSSTNATNTTNTTNNTTNPGIGSNQNTTNGNVTVINPNLNISNPNVNNTNGENGNITVTPVTSENTTSSNLTNSGNWTFNGNNTVSTNWNMTFNATPSTNYSMNGNMSTNATNTTQMAITVTTTLPTTTTEKIEVPILNNSCLGKEKWKTEEYDDGVNCLAHVCAEYMLDMFDVYMRCNDWSSPTEVQIIGGYVNKYFSLRASEMVTPRGKNPVKRTALTSKRYYYDIEYGYIRSRFLKHSVPVIFPKPDISSTSSLRLPPPMIGSEVIAYVYMEYDIKIYDANLAVSFTDEVTPLSYAIFVLDGKVKTKGVANVLNSKIVSLTTRPSLKTQNEFIDLTFEYRDYKGTLNHKCVTTLGHLGKIAWTNKGCHAVLITKKSIQCNCLSAEGNFAVISELFVEPETPPPFVQQDSTFVLAIICIVGIVACLLCLMLPYCVGCSHIGGMIRIYRYSDLTQALEYTVFLIGIYADRHITASSLIAVTLHFLHCAVIFWAIVEGIYLYHKIKPLYHNKTGMIFFYSTIAFGITAALTGAVAGFTFDFGPNEQYIWIKAGGQDLFYFLIPIGLLVLLIIIIDYHLIMLMKNWIGFHNDYVYSRSSPFIYRQSGLVGVCIVTFFLGNMSMKRGGVGYTAYLFGAFLAIQFICRFYSHFVWNYEIWDWKRYIKAQRIAASKKQLMIRYTIEQDALIEGPSGDIDEEVMSSYAESDDDEGVTEVDHVDDIVPSRHIASSPTESVNSSNLNGILTGATSDGIENPAYDDKEAILSCSNSDDSDDEYENDNDNDNDDNGKKKKKKDFEPPEREKFKHKKPKIVPRMTKAALARLQKQEENK